MSTADYVSEMHQYLSDRGSETVAKAQAQYMRNRYQFLGLKRPQLYEAYRDYQSINGKYSNHDWRILTSEMTKYQERELWYLAIDILIKNKKHLQTSDLPYIERLIIDGDWWDIVDPVASHLMARLAMIPECKEKIQSYRLSQNIWLRRTSIIYQLGYKHLTDAEYLFDTILLLSGEREFFVQKAIGWALRAYSKYEPDLVAKFISDHQHVLSPLSIREGLKHLNRNGYLTSSVH